MAISYIGVATQSAYDLDGTFSVSKPTGTAQGDLMLTFVNTFNGAPPSVPSGWSLVKNQNNASPSLGTYIYKKVAGASEPSSYSWGLDPGLDLVANLAVHTYRGVDTASPVGDSNSAVSTTAESLATGSVLTSYAGCWLVAVSGCRHNGTSSCSCSMSSMSERSDRSSADTAGSFSRSMATYDSNGAVAVGSYSRTAVVTGTTLAHNVIMLALLPKPDLAETLTDDFNDGSINTTLWTTGAGYYDGPPVEANGHLEFHSDVGVDELKGIYSALPYDMRGSSVSVEIVQPIDNDDSNLNAITVHDTSPLSPQLVVFSVTNGNLTAYNQTGDLYGFDTFDPVAHRFLRVRVSGSTWYCDTSPDCQTWTNFAQAASGVVGFSGAKVFLAIEMQSFASTTVTATGAVDNFNIAPTDYEEDVTDVEVLSDSATRVAEYNRTAADTEALSDSLGSVAEYNRSAEDVQGLSDNLSAVVGYGVTAEDSESLTDAVTSVLEAERSYADTADLSDSVTAEVDRLANASDALGLSDSVDADLVIGSHDFTAEGDDALGLSDSVTASLGLGRSAADTEELADTLSREAAYSRSATEALSLSDTAVAGLSLPRSTEDVESLSDSHTAALDKVASTTDDAGISDALTVAVDHVVSVTDTERLADTIHVGGGASIEAEEDLGLSDSVSREAGYRREATDALELAESLSAALEVSRSTTDALDLSESVTAALRLPRTATDEVGLSDSVTVSLHRSIEIADTVNLSDQASVDQAFVEITEDLIDLSDSVAWSLSRVIGDNLSLSDEAFSNGGTKLHEYADTLTLSESVTTALMRTAVEPIERLTRTSQLERLPRFEAPERLTRIGSPERVNQTEDIERTWRFDQWY